ncbi:hypothetical protein HOLleu_16714 [Holothuria leucospilota]|uniref:RNase H type-1 domain-containing protein n=1 Tax=Holothuria leucospilota TaxID=206669 RepID=A0A9Q1C747_HOLLE|nr:hypothetical protein HOLleu_16714 [Holothuria leucospilota]
MNLLLNTNNGSKTHCIFKCYTKQVTLAATGRGQRGELSLYLLLNDNSLVRLQKSVVLAWVPSQVGIRGNEKVDAIAKEALQMDVTTLYIPHTNYRLQINCYIKSKWQELWNSFPENKLYRVKPTVETVSNAVPRKRRDDLVLTRARIGHTYLTNSYLLHGDERPYCIPCDCAVTVSHILVDCCEYSHIRQKY